MESSCGIEGNGQVSKKQEDQEQDQDQETESS
jgi:hypothetical protein